MMEVKKENYRNTYFIKKYHSTREKEMRAQDREEDLFAYFKDMSPEALQVFMETKYDRCSYKNSSIIVELNQAIIERLDTLRNEFQSQQRR